MQLNNKSIETDVDSHFRVPKKIYEKVNGKFSRAHGFQCPANFYQVILIMWLIISEIVLWLFCIPLQPFDYNKYLVYVIVHIALLVFLVICGTHATLSDPTDPVIYFQRYHKFNNEIIKSLGCVLDFECSTCNMMIMEHSKHCGQCNRCCYKFDHHCKWLNNCIG